MRYLLDTNIVSQIGKQGAAQRADVVAQIVKHEFEISISAITVCELFRGALVAPRKALRESLVSVYTDVVSRVPVLPYGIPESRWHAQEWARLRASGVSVQYADCQIAATAAIAGLTLVTRNTKDFHHFDGLALENWFENTP